jgi:hypothetical protein
MNVVLQTAIKGPTCASNGGIFVNNKPDNKHFFNVKL